ncbi:MAG TPA: neutral zinc metallopeptidase [Jatrophihabitantaceae bacterium]|jgi:predicted metalloprotease
MRHRFGLTMSLLAGLAVSGCTATVAGRYVPPPTAPNSTLAVVGDSGGAFDQTVKNSLDDVFRFWRQVYPSVSGGKQLPALKGKLYSVDGAHPSAAAKLNECISKAGANAVVDNAFYCELDDSIAWDRNSQHLVPALGAKYGPLLVAMVFAHEFGHAVQERLGLFNEDAPQIVHESQADCASGAFTATVMQNTAPHLRATPADLDRALIGYLNVRDDTPADQKEISHGDGFDRIAAVADGFEHGVTECYKSDWAKRTFTERPFTSADDQASQGNEPFEQVINAGTRDQGGGGLQPDLNRFWTAAAKSINKNWTDVKIAQADHPKCGDTSSNFGYCPDDNTVYFNVDFAKQAYNSMSMLSIDQQTADVTVEQNQPGDFALGELFSYGWGLAVRHQLFDRSQDDAGALLAASCYTGAYAKDINVKPRPNHFGLSPPDMDEATNAVLSLVGLDEAYGSRGTTGLDRVLSFVKGYSGGLSVC